MSRGKRIAGAVQWNGRTQDNRGVEIQVERILAPQLAALAAADVDLDTRVDALEGAPAGGDVVGPASSVDLHVALFDGITGKMIADSGQTIAEIIAAAVAAVGGAGGASSGRWEPLANGITATPELVFNLGDVVMVWKVDEEAAPPPE